MPLSVCPECDTQVYIDSLLNRGDTIECPDCNCLLVITSIDPLKVNSYKRRTRTESPPKKERQRVTYYSILGVSQKASINEIKNAYRELVKRYHPDKNPDQAAAIRRTQIINEAYSVLKDPVKRLEYDNLLSFQNTQESTESYQAESKATHSEIHHYRCEKCSRQDETLRIIIFLWVISIFFVTVKRGHGGIFCSRCRIKYSILFNLEVFLFGWWGFPWGPIYTLEALFKNLIGGIQPPENNASLLAILAYDFYQKGQLAGAFECLNESYRLKPSKEIKEFLDYLRPEPGDKPSRTFLERALSVHPAWYNAPLLAVLFTLSLFLFTQAEDNKQSTYPAQSSAPATQQSTNAPINTTPASKPVEPANPKSLRLGASP